MDELIALGLSDLNIIVVGDKAYAGEEYAAGLEESYGIEFMAIMKNYAKNGPEKVFNKLLTKKRGITETANSVLTETMNAN